MQLSQLSQLEARFSSSQEEVDRVHKRRVALEIAMQMAREVHRVPFLEQYCTLDKVDVRTANTHFQGSAGSR